MVKCAANQELCLYFLQGSIDKQHVSSKRLLILNTMSRESSRLKVFTQKCFVYVRCAEPHVNCVKSGDTSWTKYNCET